MKTLLLALQLMTRLPIHREIEVTDRRLIQGIFWWPVIGLLTGLLDGLCFFLLSCFLPVHAAAALTILCQLGITGGFHLDGLCDTADAICSSRSKERMLQIMKDSRIGTFGVVAAIFDIGLRFLCLSSFAQPLVAIILSPVAGKCVQGLLMYRAAYPRESGLGMSYIGKISAATMFVELLEGILLIMAGLFFSGGGLKFWLIPLLIILSALIYRRYIERKIDGMTGDTLGAGNEICEIVFLLSLLAVEYIGG